MIIVYKLISVPLRVHGCNWQLLIMKYDDADDDQFIRITGCRLWTN